MSIRLSVSLSVQCWHGVKAVINIRKRFSPSGWMSLVFFSPNSTTEFWG